MILGSRKIVGFGRVVATIVVLYLSVQAPLAEARPLGPGDRAPEVGAARSGMGRPASLARLRGKWVVLTFGASWCDPCKLELPAWNKLAAHYRKQRAKVIFVAINVDEDAATGRRFLDGLGLSRICRLFDPEQRSVAAYDPPKMPTTYVIDPEGIVRHVHAGYQRGDEVHLRARLDQLLRQ